MNEKQMQKMMDEVYEDSKADTLRSMLKEFYNRRLLTIVIMVWVVAAILIAAMIVCGMKFFYVETVRSQIMYATAFICLFQFLADVKIFAWLMMHRNSIKREIKRLELRIAELASGQKGE